VAVAIVCISLIGAFQIGIDRGFRETVGTGNWGRVLFGVGTAITQMKHGGYGYVISTVIETVLTYGGLTADSVILAPLGAKFPDNLRDTVLINAAIDKAIGFRWPFNPDNAVRGSGGDDLGFVDYVRLSFGFFGYRIQSLYYTYFLIFGVSAAAYLYAFRSRPALLILLIVACAGQIVLFSSNLLASYNLGSISDPRFLGVLAAVPGLHLGCLMLDRSPPSFSNIALAIVQSVILVFAFWIRASALWVILAVTVLAGLLAFQGSLKRRFELVRMWAAGALFSVLGLYLVWVPMALHPIYKSNGEISHHVFWFAVFYQLQFHPQWQEKYASSYDFATFDELPPLAAKKYLLRHPPSNPDAVYLTADHKYLRLVAAETYVRKAFFEFFGNDPRFVLESLLVYNPLGIATILTEYISSFDQTAAIYLAGLLALFVALAGFLAIENSQRQLFKWGVLVVSGGFVLSLSPILVTVPSYPTMGEQYYALLVMLGCWVLLALSASLRMCLRLAGAIK
jgi:hypothetical protein